MAVDGFIKKMIFSNKMSFDDGKFKMLDVEGLVLPVNTVMTLINEFYEESGDKLFEALFESGRKQGEIAIKQIGEKNKMQKKEFFSKLSDSANVMGIGKVELEDFDEKEKHIIYSLEDSTMANEMNKRDKFKDREDPVAYLFKGLVHGLGENMFECEIKSEFLKSEFQGDSKTVVKARKNGNN
jgi:hypothetical protein